jgi:hypothetical protein
MMALMIKHSNNDIVKFHKIVDLIPKAIIMNDVGDGTNFYDEDVKMKTFNFAGVARENGKFVFRATNRDGYSAILEKEGKTDVQFIKLPKAMSKDEARAYLIWTDGFEAAREALTVKAKTAKAPKLTKQNAVDQIKSKLANESAIKAKNLAKLKATSAALKARNSQVSNVDREAFEAPESLTIAEGRALGLAV